MKFRVFVYGTLKKGFSLHRYLAGTRFLGEAKLSGFEMYDLGWYPGIVPGKGVIYGEVYEIGPGTLALLDEIEDEGKEYQRKLLKVELPDGRELEAFVYVYQGPVTGKVRVPGGRWTKGGKRP